jgi:hypothetical protein
MMEIVAGVTIGNKGLEIKAVAIHAGWLFPA